MDAMFDIYLLEAALNGVLLGGVLALLALGLNLIFGVIDVVWICYAELVMLGMYTVYWLHVVHGLPIVLASAGAVAVVAVLGVCVHYFVISPILGTPPINQLLATGGLLFFLQSAATLIFGIDFRNLGLRMPTLEVAEMFISVARLLAFCTALAGMVALYLFLTRTYTGAAIRAVSQDREIMVLMGVNVRRLYLVTSAIGLFVGTLWGVVRFYRVPLLTQVITVVAEILKNSPVLVQLFLVFFGFPAFFKVNVTPVDLPGRAAT